jgi:hypothetical protein
VLKLIYHTAVFGPLDLEYDRPVIRVGRSEDNDLVLRHHSVEPYHCLLVFRGEKVLCLPPDEAVGPQTDLWRLTGPELGPGDSLAIGDLRFSLAHSSMTVALPEPHREDSTTGASANDAETGSGEESQPPYYCAQCRAFVPDSAVKRVGLLGHAKLSLCPKCSRPLESQPGIVPK